VTSAPLPARLDVPWLRQGAPARVLALLDRDGEEARVVGGAVRDALIGVPISEYDIATTALPQEVVRRVVAAGFKAVPTGIEHGTVTVVVDKEPFEVTTLREDVETYGRHAKVAFGRDWRGDAQRRDFTMNALSLARDGTIHDYVGGRADLAQRRVRFIGDPARRIGEDVLRILRFFRFHAGYGEGAPDPAGLAACIAMRAGIATLSRERVRMEMLKLLIARHVVPALAAMTEAGLLVTVLGGVPLLASLANLVKLESALVLAADPIRRLAALGVFLVEDADRLRDRLRLANAEHERLCAMADGWWRVSPADGEAAARRLLYRLTPERFVDRVLLAWSRSPQGAADPAWRTLATLPARWAAPLFPLKATDLLARGMTRGPALGAALRTAEAAWIADGFPLDAAAIDALAAAAVAGSQG
jgi:tRNA nucleotidyltransferase/poly(A) polymerase